MPIKKLKMPGGVDCFGKAFARYAPWIYLFAGYTTKSGHPTKDPDDGHDPKLPISATQQLQGYTNDRSFTKREFSGNMTQPGHSGTLI